MTIEEENYWRGYIDAKVESLGKVKVSEVSESTKIKYRDKLLRKYLPNNLVKKMQ